MTYNDVFGAWDVKPCSTSSLTTMACAWNNGGFYFIRDFVA